MDHPRLTASNVTGGLPTEFLTLSGTVYSERTLTTDTNLTAAAVKLERNKTPLNAPMQEKERLTFFYSLFKLQKTHTKQENKLKNM